MNISRAAHSQQPWEAAPAAVSCCSDLSSVLLREELMGMLGSHPGRASTMPRNVSCSANPTFHCSALSGQTPASPSTNCWSLVFPWGKDPILSNHPEEFWCFQNFSWGFGALIPAPLRVTNTQYKSSCVWSFHIRLKPIYSGGQKAQKESRKTAFVSVRSNEFHGKLASESIQSWMHDAGFVLVGLSCYRRCGFLFCEVLKGFESFVILLLISVWQCHAWSKQGSTEKNTTQLFPCSGPYSCSVGKNPKLFQCQEISPV